MRRCQQAADDIAPGIVEVRVDPLSVAGTTSG
jgi:hypothetical protein